MHDGSGSLHDICMSFVTRLPVDTTPLLAVVLSDAADPQPAALLRHLHSPVIFLCISALLAMCLRCLPRHSRALALRALPRLAVRLLLCITSVLPVTP